MKKFSANSQAEMRQVFKDNQQSLEALQKLGRDLVAQNPCPNEFSLDGFCQVCRSPSRFHASYHHRFKRPDGVEMPNWRETLVCEGCRLNNRMRGSLAIGLEGCSKNDAIYVTEQTTPLYDYVHGHYPQAVGSEYFHDGTKRGRKNRRGIRFEDLTQLTFGDGSFDRVLSFEVLEHIPEFVRALQECHRVLKPGGRLVLTAPFARNRTTTLRRARLDHHGVTVHIEPPEYHGDPMVKDGILCFYHFGWDLLDILRAVGFETARTDFYWGSDSGHLGGMHAVFVAEKYQ